MTDDLDLSQLSLVSLHYRCAQETARYLNHRPCDPRFCYELFRRAIQASDQQAWEAVFQIYHRLVTAWVARHPHFTATNEDAEFIANGAFARMAKAIPPAKFNRFPDLAHLLRFLQMCVHSEIEDNVKPTDEPLQEETGSSDRIGPSGLLDPADRASFYALINTRLRDDKERLAIRYRFVYDLAPKRIVAEYPNAFRDVGEIYDVLANVLERLRRDRQLGAWFNDYLGRMPEK